MSTTTIDQKFPIVRLESFFYVLAIVLIVSLPFLPYTQFVILVCWLLAKVLQTRRPIIVVLRRFESHSDLALTNSLLQHLERFGRVIWLKNTEGEHPFLRIKRVTVTAGMYLIGLTVAAFIIFVVSRSPWLIAIFGTVYIGLGSMLLLEYAVGNSSHPRLFFFAFSWIVASSSWGKALSSQFGVEHNTFTSSLFLLMVYFVGVSVRQLLYRGFYNQITSGRHYAILKKEISKRFKIRRRLDSPAVASEIFVSNAWWRQVVALMLEHAKRAAIDISNLKLESGLAWEVLRCDELRVKVLYICHEDKLESAKAVLSQLTGKAAPHIVVYSQGNSHDEFTRLLCAARYFTR